MSRRKPGRLLATWSKRERDMLYDYSRKADGGLLHYALSQPVPGCEGRTLLQELERRGYDVTTFRLVIDRAEDAAKGAT
jgi:hypothetical protein